MLDNAFNEIYQGICGSRKNTTWEDVFKKIVLPKGRRKLESSNSWNLLTRMAIVSGKFFYNKCDKKSSYGSF